MVGAQGTFGSIHRRPTPPSQPPGCRGGLQGGRLGDEHSVGVRDRG